MRTLVLLPDALVVAGAIGTLLAGRFMRLSRRRRSMLPAIAAVVLLAAFGLELWLGSVTADYFGRALVQDRFALFVKAAALLSAAVAIAVTDWSAEDSVTIGVAMPMLAAFGIMVAASANDVVGLWVGLELAAVAAVVLVSLRRPEAALRLILTGGVATTLILAGLVFLYATAGSADLHSVREALTNSAPTLALALPILLLLGGLAMRAGVIPFQFAHLTFGFGASPLGAGLVLGLVAAAALTATIKLAGILSPVPDVYSPYLAVIAGLAMAGGGAGALAARSPRVRMAYLGVAQVGWVAAGLSTHYRAGLGASLFLLGAFAIAASAGPAMLGAGVEAGEAGLAGMGVLRPARAAGIALAVLSLAGAPPLAGFFGVFAVAAALAQSGSFILLGVGLVSSALGLAAAVGTLRAIYLQSLPEEGRRPAGAALPALTRFSTAGAVIFCVFIAAYGLLGNPILGLADQGAEALGLR